MLYCKFKLINHSIHFVSALYDHFGYKPKPVYWSCYELQFLKILSQCVVCSNFNALYDGAFQNYNRKAFTQSTGFLSGYVKRHFLVQLQVEL